MAIGSNLKVIMVQKKISQTKLAELTGISRTSITLIANEKSAAFEIETALKISRALDVPVNEIWYLTDED